MRITPPTTVLNFRTLIFALTTVLFTGFAAQSVRAQFLHPKIKSKETTIRNVVVFPARVNVVRDSMKGPEGMSAESDELSARVEKLIDEVLSKEKHITTLAGPGATSTGGDSSQRYNIADFQT